MFEPHAKRSARTAALTALLACAVNATAVEPHEIPMTHAEIVAYGGDPKLPHLYYQLPPTRVWDSEAEPSTKSAGSFQGLTSQAAEDFRPLDERDKFNRPAPNELTCLESSQESRAESQLQLPQGATLRFIRLFASDTNASHNVTASVIRRCQATTAASDVTATVLVSVSTIGSSGSQVRNAEFPLFQTIDNLNCVYVVRAQMNTLINGCAAGLTLNKVRIAWDASP